VARDLLTLEAAIARVLARAQPLEPEEVELRVAGGRVLVEPARAATDLPPFASSAMDGYAVRSADTPASLRVVAQVAAGRPVDQPLRAGDAIAIATGGVVPDGADAVVPVEEVTERDGTIEVGRVSAGAHVRARGGDVRAGGAVLDAGTRLTPAHIGALAAAGVARLTCSRRPRAAVLATGTELRPPGEPLRPGEIYEANGSLLAAALSAAGADVLAVQSVEDDEDAHARALESALAADLVISSGGVSVGPHDLVRRVAARLGVEELFWRVAVKPGKPILFGARGATLVFGLPGNPVSTLVGFELFVRPALRALASERDPGPRWREGRLARAVKPNPARDELLRARSQRDGLAPLDGQESHMIVRAAAADALVLVPRGEGELAAGSSVRWLPLA
jgi:molybdopterin molybdotransferase